ncbi:MAG: type II toxin-antitoxin system VapC family toxin [Salinarimonas sp.]
MDIDRIIRRCRTARDATILTTRPIEELDRFAESDVPGERIMLDTCVFIDQLQGKLPEAIEERVTARTIMHSPAVIGELSFLIGRLDPKHPGTGDAITAIRDLLAAVPEHRIFNLTPDDVARGNILAGCMARLLGHDRESRRNVQSDAVLAAQAARLGCLLVTRNLGDFDHISQLEPRLRVAFY